MSEISDRLAVLFDKDAKAAAVAHAAGTRGQHNLVTTGMSFLAGVEWAVERLPTLLRQVEAEQSK